MTALELFYQSCSLEPTLCRSIRPDRSRYKRQTDVDESFVCLSDYFSLQSQGAARICRTGPNVSSQSLVKRIDIYVCLEAKCYSPFYNHTGFLPKKQCPLPSADVAKGFGDGVDVLKSNVPYLHSNLINPLETAFMIKVSFLAACLC